MTEHNPVIDTLELAAALRRTGLPQEQADGIARAVGTELAGRVPLRSDMAVMRSDLEGKIDGVRSDLKVVRSDLEAKIEDVRSEIKVVRSDLDAKIESARSDIRALSAKLNLFGLGVGLTLALLSVLVGLELFRQPVSAPVPPVSPVTVNFPATGPWTAPTAVAPTTEPAP